MWKAVEEEQSQLCICVCESGGGLTIVIDEELNDMGVAMESSQVERRVTLSTKTETENISVSKSVTVTTYRERDQIYCARFPHRQFGQTAL